MAHKPLFLDLGERSYPIHIGRGLITDEAFLAAELIPNLPSRQVFLVTNTTVGPLYADRLVSALPGCEFHRIELPDGEQYKTLETLSGIIDRMMEVPCDRNTTVLALGGGVVGDIAGFAAACYRRGVPYVQVPTTLLSQVDSSVGGKTAVNHPSGKNMIGAFYQPGAVIIDTDTLGTLDVREFRAGLAEVIKYGLIRDREFFEWLEENLDPLLARDPDALAWAIRRSCQNKAEVVADDEREAGQRALLNLGHTFGHAIEAATGYTDWLHGEAVAAGILMAMSFSTRAGLLAGDDTERARSLFSRAGLRTRPPEGLTADEYLGYMARDKKVAEGMIRLVLMRKIGDAFVTADFDHMLLRETLEESPGT